MPIKSKGQFTPLWRKWDEMADKAGLHHTVYFVNGDKYTGDWATNKKQGKGTFEWKSNKAIYDGDWENDVRCGYGTYSLPKPDGTYEKVYAGGWKDDKRHGYGAHYYSADEYYEGEWYADKRCGWGRMKYEDGSKYEGEWYDDMRNGRGMIRMANNNRYEGSWKNGKKHGTGKFFYLDKGKLFDGVWVEDVPKCGEMVDFARDEAPEATEFPIPQLSLDKPDEVLNASKKATLYYAFNGHIPAGTDKGHGSTPFGEVCYTPWLIPPNESAFNYKFITKAAQEMSGFGNAEEKPLHRNRPPKK